MGGVGLRGAGAFPRFHHLHFDVARVAPLEHARPSSSTPAAVTPSPAESEPVSNPVMGAAP